MVTYQEWTGIVFDVLRDKGMTEPSQNEVRQTVSVAAEVWRARKTELRGADRARARRIAEAEIAP